MNITLNAWQSDVVRSNARYKVLRCGRRAGKTYLSCVLIIAKAMEKKGIYWFLAPYYRQAKEIAWQIFNELLPSGAVRKRNEQELSFTLRNGSEIKLKGADSPDSLKGVGIDGIVLDEYAFCKPNVWQEIIRPMLYDRNGWALFISTPQGYNHFYDLWEQAGQLDDWDRFHYTTMDNPKISGSEIEASRREMSKEKFAQEILAEFTKIEGAIFKEFSRDLHVIPKKQPDKSNPIYGSLDFGFSIGHPTAFGLHEVNSEQIFTFDGFMTEQLDPNSMIEKVRSFSAGLSLRALYCDSARPDLIDMLIKAGLPAQPAKKDVELGIAKVGEFMKINEATGKPKWAISAHLKDMIWQIENYEWEQYRGEDGNFKSRPKKENDDACFSKGTKILMADKTEKNIEEVQVGEFIWTPFGKTKVLNSGLTGIKDTYKFRNTRITKNHKILTQRGLIPIDTLRYSDTILLWNKQKSFFKTYRLDGILTQNILTYAIIFTHLLIRNLEANQKHCTGTFGKSILGKFLLAIISIIRMGIHWIIPSIISNVFHQKNTIKDIIKKICLNGDRILKKLFSQQVLGQKLKKDKNLEKNLARRMSSIFRGTKLKEAVICAVKSIFLKQNLENSATKTVKLPHCVEEEVYNLTTENGVLIANNVVYSNCDMIRYFLFSFTQIDPKQQEVQRSIFKKLSSYNPWR